MHQLKNVTVEGYEALRNIDPRKWTRFAFWPRTNCRELVNNWVEAFNVFIIKAKDQPIITMLNTIHHTIMTRIVKEREKKLKCKGSVGPRIDEVLEKREEKLYEFIVRASGSPRYEVTSAHHSFVVDLEKKECSCGLWQLGGASSILPPDIRVLPRRPKRCRKKVIAERREEVEKQASKQLEKGVFKASWKETVIHCKICGGIAHNERTYPKKLVDGEPAPSRSKRTSTLLSQPATTSAKSKKKKTELSSC
ncbi:hypothetical protein LIER_17949 [Lithospermum erythrorhizon]|uniref:Uncharacterized protein n=1 Tax=Lithospermum erythrorhizon TaxID=34254 RepID=A0AAV3QCA6_LITER